MNSKLVLLSFVFFICGLSIVKPDENLDKVSRLTKNFAEIGQIVAKFAQSKEFSAAANVIQTLSTTVGYFVPFVSIISDVIGIYENLAQEDQFAEIKSTLTEIQSQLNKGIEKLSNIPGEEHAIALFKEKSQFVYDVNKAFEKYSKNPNNISRSELIKECDRKSMINYFNYLEREITVSQYHDTLKRVLLRDYNWDNLHFWIVKLISYTEKAIYLHSFCIGVLYPPSQDVMEFIKNDLKMFETISKQMSDMLTEAHQELEFKFWDNKAKEEIDDLNNENTKLNHKDWANKLYTHLSTKYTWRKWLVMAWDTQGFINTAAPWGISYSSYTQFYELDERTALISSTKTQINSKASIDKCLKPHHEKENLCSGKSKAALIKDVIKGCVTNYNAIAVVIEEENLAIEHDPIICHTGIVTKCPILIVGTKETYYDVVVV